MFVFACAGCGSRLTVPLSQVALPTHAHQKYGNGIRLPVLMESGTFAVEPEPWGPPWRRWEEVTPEEATARGIHAAVYSLSDGAPGSIVIAPGDSRGMVFLPEEGGGYCCGLAWGDGPNMACEACGVPVASRIDDCSLWQAVWLAPDAVRRLPADDTDTGTGTGPGSAFGSGSGSGPAPLGWAELLADEYGTPPVEPVVSWASARGMDHWWSWSPQWEAAAGQALAHMLAASDGRSVTVPPGLTSEVFRRALDALLPAVLPARRAVLAGPGLPAPGPDADMLLVPMHPQTGELWSPADAADPPAPVDQVDRAAAAYRVPLPFGVWIRMAYPEPRLRLPAPGAIPAGVLRDDPPAPRPRHPFRIDSGTFERTLVRLPAVRSDWLHDILENLTHHMCAGLF
ncbi:hypothetical protein [Streptomyces sp. cmx-4-9]|uniref:hypothetical protein n=1 Tax=Streptomyces sp. cmx-4-9 TaxID=2790941 RepID=UPI00397EB470